MPACDSVNEVNTPIAYSGISLWTSAWNRTTSSRRRDRETDDAVREDEPMPALGERAGHEVVFRVEVREAREVGERRVGRQDQDQGRRDLEHRGTARSRSRPLPKTALPDLGDDGLRLASARPGASSRGTRGPRNITPSRLPIHISVVRAFRHSGGLNAGTPLEIASTPVTAAPPEANACRIRKRPIAPVVSATSAGMGSGCRSPASDLARPDAEEQEHHHDEEVGRDGEHPPGLPHPPQVAPGDDPDERDREPDAVRVEPRDGGRDRGHAGRHRDRHREDVIGQQRDPGQLRGQEPEVVLRDDVGATGARVGLDRLAVGEQEDRQHGQDAERDRHDDRERQARPTRRDRDLQDLLGRVGDRGEVVAREDRERGGLAEPLVLELRRRERGPEEQRFQRCPRPRGRGSVAPGAGSGLVGGAPVDSGRAAVRDPPGSFRSRRWVLTL